MYHPVRLLRDFETEGHKLLKGARGVLVERFSDNDYGVEFEEPQDVLIIPVNLLAPA